MSQVFRFKKLPLAVQNEISERLRVNGYSDYDALADELRGRGYRISKSGLHRISLQLRSDANFLYEWAQKNTDIATVLVAAIKAAPSGGIKINLPPVKVVS
ncbi:MAG: DUF3486 family protein [Proteobacteria bacterium]|nr:DUF3486 family protein [Pseudomonadota bacterium]